MYRIVSIVVMTVFSFVFSSGIAKVDCSGLIELLNTKSTNIEYLEDAGITPQVKPTLHIESKQYSPCTIYQYPTSNDPLLMGLTKYQSALAFHSMVEALVALVDIEDMRQTLLNDSERLYNAERSKHSFTMEGADGAIPIDELSDIENYPQWSNDTHIVNMFPVDLDLKNLSGQEFVFSLMTIVDKERSTPEYEHTDFFYMWFIAGAEVDADTEQTETLEVFE